MTGCLQQKNGYYYAVLYLKVDGKRKTKWIPTKLPVEGTSSRKAKQTFEEIREQFEKDEAKRLEEEAIAALEAAEAAKYHPDALLEVSAYAVKWLEASKPNIAAATYQSYNNLVKARIVPWFLPRNIKLKDLAPQDIDDFYQSILADGCKTNTVIHYHAILRKALQTAVKKGILKQNPADKVDRPRKNIYHSAFYSADEMLTLFDAVSGDPLEVCVKIAAYYGLRRSEVLGLKWSAVDFENKTLSVSHKVIEVREEGRFVPVGEDVLKTKSSFRTLPLIPAVESLLLEERERQETQKRLFKSSYCGDYLDYICVDQTGRLLRPNYVTEHFGWVLDKYDLKRIRFHDLRHSCASLLLSSGISMKQIQIWLGHSTFATTADIYAHLDFSAQAESAAAMDGMFRRK